MSRRLLFVATLVATLSLAAHADEPLPSVEQVMNEHKEKIRNQLETINYKRKRMVEANMALDGTEAETFWPIYSRYRGETDSLHKETFQLLLEYARAYGSGSITDAEASRMVDLYRDCRRNSWPCCTGTCRKWPRRCHLGGPCASCRSKRSWTRWRRCRSASRFR